jgi:hypothetical protein
VVFDPFAGGGMTIDVCLARKRRYYVSDLSPIPAREQDIRAHDITTGLPRDLPVPDLVFLDPPYWRQAKGKYSEKASDLSNVELDAFLDSIGAIARDVKRKWRERRGLTNAVRRGVVCNDAGHLRPDCRTTGEYPRELLRRVILTVVGRTWYDRESAIHNTAYHLGFRRLGPAIRDTLTSVLRAALRMGLLESAGDLIRRAQ